MSTAYGRQQTPTSEQAAILSELWDDVNQQCHPEATQAAIDMLCEMAAACSLASVIEGLNMTGYAISECRQILEDQAGLRP